MAARVCSAARTLQQRLRSTAARRANAHSTIPPMVRGWASMISTRSVALHSSAELPKRSKSGELVFEGFPQFRPNLTPAQVLQLGSFGGTYFRPIKSGITGQKYTGAWKEFPREWFEGLDIRRQVASSTYDESVNRYGVKCGADLDMWESKGWIVPQDPYGWFQWYCRFYLGRRTEDDARQIARALGVMGPKGRFRNQLIRRIARETRQYNDENISPVIRQTLQHWGYELSEKAYESYVKKHKL